MSAWHRPSNLKNSVAAESLLPSTIHTKCVRGPCGMETMQGRELWAMQSDLDKLTEYNPPPRQGSWHLPSAQRWVQNHILLRMNCLSPTQRIRWTSWRSTLTHSSFLEKTLRRGTEFKLPLVNFSTYNSFQKVLVPVRHVKWLRMYSWWASPPERDKERELEPGIRQRKNPLLCRWDAHSQSVFN